MRVSNRKVVGVAMANQVASDPWDLQSYCYCYCYYYYCYYYYYLHDGDCFDEENE